MNPTEYQQNIAKAVNYFENEFNREFTLLGVQTMAAAIRNRVQNKGTNSLGNKFRPYSTKPTLVGQKSFMNPTTFAAKVLPQVKKQQLAAKKGTEVSTGNYTWVTTVNGHRLVVLLGGYKKIRELEGLKTTFKGFTRTTMMWSGFGIKAQTKKSFILGGKTPESVNKITWNSLREKDNIIAPTDQEIDILTEYVGESVMKKLKEFGFA